MVAIGVILIVIGIILILSIWFMTSILLQLKIFITNKLNEMGQELDKLTTEVAENSTVIDSAIVLLKGIKAKLDEAIASGNPAALKALSDSLGAKTDELAAAVVENTPAEEETPPA